MIDWFRIANEAEIPSPALLVYPDRIAENIRRMAAAAGGADRLRPHIKTHKLPEVMALFRQQGISRFKAATVAEAEMAAAAGAGDVLLAYPAVGPTGPRLAALARAFPQTTFRALTDSDVGIDDLDRAACQAGLRLDTLLDLNVGMDRTGVPPGPEAVRLAHRIAAAAGLSFGGLHAYDGHLHAAERSELARRVAAAFAPVWKLRADLEAAGIPVPLLAAGGTPTSSLLAAYDNVEVGAGTTVLWDAGQPTISPDLDYLHAAVLLIRVISKPAPGLACLDLGHKAVASEMPQPRVTIFGLEQARFPLHSEEHLVVETPLAADLAVGTVLYGLPRHVCPTVALYDEAIAVYDGRAAERWQVTARNRRISI